MDRSQHWLADRVTRNALSNLALGMVSLPITLVVTPVLVARLGTTAFGVWALVQAFTSYIGLLDLGISSAVIKLVAQYRGSSQERHINDTLSTGLVVHLCVGTTACLLIYALRDWIVRMFFQGTGAYSGDVPLLLVGSSVFLAANLTLSVFPSLLIGLQRMDLANVSAIVRSLLSALASVVVVLLGWGLPGLLLVSAGTTVVSSAISIVLARAQYPGLRISLRRFRPAMIRSLLGLSLKYQVISLAVLIHAQFDKLILGHFIGADAVAYYQIAGSAVERLRSFPLMLLQPIMPAASQLEAQKQQRATEILYRRAVRYVGVVSFPVFILITALAYPIVRLWIGPGYEWTAFALQFLALASLVNMLSGPAGAILAGGNRPRYAVYSAVLGILLNVALSPTLAWRYGFSGAVIATSLSLTIACLFSILLFHRVTGAPLAGFTSSVKLAGLLAITAGVGVWGIAPQVHSWLRLVSTAAAFAVLYLVGLLLLGWLEPADRVLLRRYVGKYLPRRVL